LEPGRDKANKMLLDPPLLVLKHPLANTTELIKISSLNLFEIKCESITTVLLAKSKKIPYRFNTVIYLKVEIKFDYVKKEINT
jgi:hypothetical protein